MIDVKQAAKAAAEYFVDLYADQQFSDILLEEVEYDEAGGAWLITIGYSPPRTIWEETVEEVKIKNPLSPLSDLPSTFTRERKYKIFKIDTKTGKVLSMKIRTVEHA